MASLLPSTLGELRRSGELLEIFCRVCYHLYGTILRAVRAADLSVLVISIPLEYRGVANITPSRMPFSTDQDGMGLGMMGVWITWRVGNSPDAKRRAASYESTLDLLRSQNSLW